jgi:hypothetical protein
MCIFIFHASAFEIGNRHLFRSSIVRQHWNAYLYPQFVIRNLNSSIRSRHEFNNMKDLP